MGEEGEEHKEKILTEKGQSRQKVGTEISCSAISSGREGGKIFEKLVL